MEEFKDEAEQVRLTEELKSINMSKDGQEKNEACSLESCGSRYLRVCLVALPTTSKRLFIWLLHLKLNSERTPRLDHKYHLKYVMNNGE